MQTAAPPQERHELLLYVSVQEHPSLVICRPKPRGAVQSPPDLQGERS